LRLVVGQPAKGNLEYAVEESVGFTRPRENPQQVRKGRREVGATELMAESPIREGAKLRAIERTNERRQRRLRPSRQSSTP
jgi:hypothetical protein